MTGVIKEDLTVSGSVTAVTVQNVLSIDDLGWLTPASGQMTGPMITFYVIFDADTEDFYLCKEGQGIWFAGCEQYSWEAARYVLENIRDDVKGCLNVTDQHVDALFFYLQANVEDEAEDIDESEYTHQWIPTDAAGEIDAAVHFSTESEAANRIWVSTAQNLNYINVCLRWQDLSLDFDSDSLEEKEVVSWTKHQLATNN